MKPTKLLYLDNMYQLECEAYVEEVKNEENKAVIYLDQTVFYPQGGGQPYDTGTVYNEDTKFIVDEVRFVDGQVLHIGKFKGRPFMQGEDVKCQVDKERRELNARLHSAGHIIDMAVNKLGYDWVPGKGYHFPEGSYVEYEIKDEVDNEKVRVELEKTIHELIAANPKTSARQVSREELAKLCRFVPDYIPKDKPIRVVSYGDFGVPCGGIHVAQLKDIGKVTIRKVKQKGNVLRISYEIS